VRAEEEEVRADRFPARAELLIAFLRAAQHEAIAEDASNGWRKVSPSGSTASWPHDAYARYFAPR